MATVGHLPDEVADQQRCPPMATQKDMSNTRSPMVCLLSPEADTP